MAWAQDGLGVPGAGSAVYGQDHFGAPLCPESRLGSPPRSWTRLQDLTSQLKDCQIFASF